MNASEDSIVRAKIHPAIGVARVGNSVSRDDFFIGPEVVSPKPHEPVRYRDENGALKRQAARFRIYGYDAAGEVVRELTADCANIRWAAHVANRKAAFYQWWMALDIPEAASFAVPLRNASIAGAQRNGLAIDGGKQSTAGRNVDGKGSEFHGLFVLPGNAGGQPLTTDVYLGELRTDEHGRLLFLGGRGVAGSPTGAPIYDENDENTFINANQWYDDTSDGPVTAEVDIQGRAVPVEPAWVVTAPPDYAPGILGVRTLYDLLFDLYVRAGWLPVPPQEPSFARDVHPILERLSRLQWVNQGFAAEFGHGGRHDFEDVRYFERLARDPTEDGVDLYIDLRRRVLNYFRNPTPADGNQVQWPWLYGDAMGVPDSPRQNATVTPTQYGILQAWANGKFKGTLAGTPDAVRSAPATIDDVPLADQPRTLDEAALTHCLADAFHPGCEMTWPVRHLTLYSGPFRVRHRCDGARNSVYGDTLDQSTALSVDGPLYAQGPGDLTRWMGLPWHADAASCLSGYDTTYDPYVPTFWPAHVPNHVMTKVQYDVVINAANERSERLEAFLQRTSWDAPLQGATDVEQMQDMVGRFGSMGLVEVRDGVSSDPDFPTTMRVASYGPGISADGGAQPAPGVAVASRMPPSANVRSRPRPVRRPKK